MQANAIALSRFRVLADVTRTESPVRFAMHHRGVGHFENTSGIALGLFVCSVGGGPVGSATQGDNR